MKNNLPLVSIITPSFNQGRFIEENLLSVKFQNYPNIEHIVIDGGSTDETLNILKKYEGTYNLRWVSEPDKGHADAVNKGFEMAKGEIIGWLNSDDVYFDRNTVAIVVEIFQNHADVDIVYGDCAYIWEDGTILRVQCTPKFKYSRLLRGCFLEQPAVFFRKHVVKTFKLNIQLKVAIDYEYWLRIGQCCNFYHVPRILAADRNHKKRISIAQAEKLKSVSQELRMKYIKKHTEKTYLFYFIGWQLEKVFSGIPRRIKGLIELLSLTDKYDFAFKAKLNLNFNILKNQLFPKGVEKLRP